MRKNSTDPLDTSAEPEIQQPRNTLLTPFGRRVDRLTYLQLSLLALTVILLSACYFWWGAPGPNSLDKQAGKCFSEALYFSVVTFTTLGYGDLVPVGFGRLVAGLESLSGIFLAALLIGKVASERQSALLLLIYTSDQQRRLSGFSERISEFAAAFESFRIEEQDVVDCGHLISSLQAYLMFQTHQGRLADFGNSSALQQIYRTLLELQSSISALLSGLSIAPSDETRILRIAGRVARLSSIMRAYHKGDEFALRTLRSVAATKENIDVWQTHAVTRRRLQQVLATVPPKPWPKHFHKRAASALGISASLYRKCLNALIALRKNLIQFSLPVLNVRMSPGVDASLSLTLS